MVNFATPPGLEGLFDLDRKGVDIRPTLLRVLTDQYIRTPVHSPDEQRHYTELAMRLLDETDIATRAAVSVRLAPHAGAPHRIILQLARDVLEVAEPVLLHSPVLTLADCDAIIRERGRSYAEILARRSKPAATSTAAPAPKRETRSLKQIAPARPTAPSPVAAIKENKRDNAVAASAAGINTGLIDNAEARELTELFFAAEGAERRQILLSLDYAAWPAGEPPAPLHRTDIWRMETAALRHHTANLMHELERALGISIQHSRRIVEDELGEPIVVAAKAMGLPSDVLQRIVLFMNPRVGQSVDRVFELSALYREISVEAARRLVAILRAAAPASQRTRDRRAINAATEPVRHALADVASIPPRKAEPQLRTAAGAHDA